MKQPEVEDGGESGELTAPEYDLPREYRHCRRNPDSDLQIRKEFGKGRKNSAEKRTRKGSPPTSRRRRRQRSLLLVLRRGTPAGDYLSRLWRKVGGAGPCQQRRWRGTRHLRRRKKRKLPLRASSRLRRSAGRRFILPWSAPWPPTK